MGKAASLNPGDMLTGGRVPDGRYTIKSVTAEVFDYGGKSSQVPAACIVFKSNDGTEHEQYYSAGDLEYLTPNEAKTQFVHPRGEDAKISQNSNLGKFIKALVNAGFPTAELTAELSCLNNVDLELVAQAQPKNQSGKENVLSLPTKYHGRAGKATKAPARPTARPAPSAPSAGTATTSAAPAASATSNGAFDVTAELKAILSAAPEVEGLQRVKISYATNKIMLGAAKAKADIQAARKQVSDVAWLTENGDANGWMVDGDELVRMA